VRLFIIIAFILGFGGALVAQPAKVMVVKQGDHWRLMKNGVPYYIKGAGGTVHLDLLVECGGNTIRTWGVDDAQKILDEAHSKGLMVMLGMWVQHERHGFDYDNNLAVQKQIRHFKSIVDQFKNHPALLMWGIGNEVDLFYQNTKVWHSIQAIAKYIHETDPNHPTCTVTAGLDSLEVQHIKEKAPDIDIYGVNTYGDIGAVPANIKKFGWTGPYMITEWGPNGHWESPVTPWNAAIEQSSSEKAMVYGERYQKYIQSDSQQCIGSYVFLWGQKQEYTLTWYGLFTKDNMATEAVDRLYQVWTGKPPKTPTPTIYRMLINNKAASEGIVLDAGSVNAVSLHAGLIHYTETAAPDGGYKVVWKMLAESDDKKAGGDMENEAAEITHFMKKEGAGTMHFKAPRQPGGYRLFAMVYYQNKVAYNNIPFKVVAASSDDNKGAVKFKKFNMESFSEQ
jgi:hypothetical protein